MFLILCFNLVILCLKFIKFLFSLICTLNLYPYLCSFCGLYPCCFCKLLGFVFMHLQAFMVSSYALLHSTCCFVIHYFKYSHSYALVGSCSQMHTCCVHWLSVGHANDALHLSLLACMSECSFLMRMSIVITIL